MINEFVERIKKEYMWSGETLRRVLSTGEFKIKDIDIIDIYCCAWWNLFVGCHTSEINNIVEHFYSNIPGNFLINRTSEQLLLEYLKNDLPRHRGEDGSWNHSKVNPEDPVRLFIQAASNTPFEFNGWMRSGSAANVQYQPCGLVAERFLTQDFFNRHASNVGVILNWDASFMDVDNDKYRLMVIDRWEEIIYRMVRRFGGENKKLPRFCYGFNDFYLLRPIAVSILRGKKVPDELFKWFCLWHFRRVWTDTPSDRLFSKAVCKDWGKFREVIEKEGYKRSHMFNFVMRMLHLLKTVPLTREQLGDIYPVLIRAAIKKNDVSAANFLQII
jgi:hypothetical protein